MSFKRSLLSLAFLCTTIFSYGGIRVDLDEKATIQFPSFPEVLDTLGKISYSLTDGSGYYAVLIVKNVTSDMSTFELQKFYKQMFERMQSPDHACQLIKESNVNLTDVLGVEYYSNCREMEDFPDIRYKRFFVYQGDFYIIDYWTYKNQLANAPNFKAAFFNSLAFKKNENVIIPPAIENTKGPDSNPGIIENSKWLILFIFLLLGVLIFLRRKPKK